MLIAGPQVGHCYCGAFYLLVPWSTYELPIYFGQRHDVHSHKGKLSGFGTNYTFSAKRVLLHTGANVSSTVMTWRQSYLPPGSQSSLTGFPNSKRDLCGQYVGKQG